MASAFLALSFSLALFLSYEHDLLVSCLQSNSSSRNDVGITGNKLPVHNDSGFPMLPEYPNSFLRYLLTHSDYIHLPTTGAGMLYYFFDIRSEEENPVMLWLTGVPGLTSSIALFRENGPFHIRQQDGVLIPNDYGWDKEVKMIYVDEPVGTGFSYIDSSSDIRHDQAGVVDDLYNFLLVFFEKHHSFKDNDFYIAGQTYAGKYAPALATRILQGNQLNPHLKINLKGVAIGNGFINPEKQFGTAIRHTERTIPHTERTGINDEVREALMMLKKQCKSDAKSCDLVVDENSDETKCKKAYNTCDNLIQGISTSTGRNVYDVRIPKGGVLNYDFSDIHAVLNQEEVKRYHKLDESKSFNLFNSEIFDAMKKGDYVKNAEAEVLNLLKNDVHVLVYAGEYDMLCNYLGNELWVTELDWKRNTEEGIAKTSKLTVNQEQFGSWRQYERLSFLRVDNAGHMVGMDQPKAAFQMLKDWIKYTNTPILS